MAIVVIKKLVFFYVIKDRFTVQRMSKLLQFIIQTLCIDTVTRVSCLVLEYGTRNYLYYHDWLTFVNYYFKFVQTIMATSFLAIHCLGCPLAVFLQLTAVKFLELGFYKDKHHV